MANLFVPSSLSLEILLNHLRDQLDGSVFTPEDPGYEAAQQAWNLSVNQHPAVIVVAQSAADIAAAIRFARNADLEVAIQATGHGIARPANGALLIITSNLNKVEIDPVAQTARIESGAMWIAVLEKAQQFGLAPLLGSSPYVGVTGYTLGGGMGWLARKYGMALDSVHAFELVTANGSQIRASESENQDLFWALRGGGGNFGVVTAMEIQLYPVKSVYGGHLMYPGQMAKAALQHFRGWIVDLPDEITTSISVMNFPRLPQIPEFLRGQTVVFVRACYVGAAEDGAALMQPWLDWMAPMDNSLREMPFMEIGSISNDPQDPMPGHSTGAWISELSDEAIDKLLEYVISTEGPSPIVSMDIRYAGGAISRVGGQENAYGNRGANLLMQAVGITPTPVIHAAFVAFIEDWKADLKPYLTGGVYMNFLEGKEARERTRNGFTPENFARLQTIKARYDAENRFSHSFDIKPVSDHLN